MNEGKMSNHINLISHLNYLQTHTKENAKDGRGDLMNICKKIDVKKKLVTEYESDWNESFNGEPLNSVEWEKVLLILSDFSEQENRKEYRYKILNTILKGRDIAKSLPGSDGILPQLHLIEEKIQGIMKEMV